MASVRLQGFEDAERKLLQLPIEMRGNTIKSGLRTAGRAVARAAETLVPIGHTRETHLRDSFVVSVKEGRMPYCIVGPSWFTGRHGILVEGQGGDDMHQIDVRHHSHGKPTGIILRKQPFLMPAADITRLEQEKAMTDAINRAIERVMG